MASDFDEAQLVLSQLRNNPAKFLVLFTDLFGETDPDGKFVRQKLYPKQVEYLNGLKPTDKVVAVVKTRQCISGDSFVYTEDGPKMIKDLCDSSYRGKVWTNDLSGNSVLDEVVDIWEVGVRNVMRLTLQNLSTIKLTPDHMVRTDRGWIDADDLLADDIVWTQFGGKSGIESIKRMDLFEVVYDMTTKHHSSFIANGIHVHNCGFTTAAIGKTVTDAYYGKVGQTVIGSASKDQAIKVMDRVKRCFESMPEFMRPEFTKETAAELHLASGTKIFSVSSNPDTMRGNTGNVILDEFGVKNRKESQEIWSAILPSIVKGGRITAISSPKGSDNIFYDLCNYVEDENGNAISGLKPDKVIRVHYTDVPHVLANIDIFKKTMHPTQFAQEFECAFVSNDDMAFFETRLLDIMQDYELQLIKIPAPAYANTGHSIEDSWVMDLSEQFPNGIYIGYDAAMTGDGSVVTALGIDKYNVWKLVFMYEFPKEMTVKNQVDFVAKLYKILRAKKVGYDSTGGLGQSVAAAFKDINHTSITKPFLFTNATKFKAYNDLRELVVSEKFKIPISPKEIIGQFGTLGFNPISQKIQAVGGKKDDIPSSIITAIQSKASDKMNGIYWL